MDWAIAMKLKTSLENIERYSAKLWRLHCKENKNEISLSFNEYDYLKVIQYADEPMRLTDIAGKLEVSKPSASTMIVRLEKRGFILRIPCEDDARVSHIVLTEKAKVELNHDDAIYANFSDEIATALSQEEYQQLELLLAKLFTKLVI